MSPYTMAARVMRGGAGVVSAVALAALLSSCGGEDSASDTAHEDTSGGDFMVVANRPNALNLIDLEARKVVKRCDLPGDFGIGTVAVDAPNRIAYVLTNRFENVYGVKFDTCELVFSAKQSHDDIRIKSIGSIAVSADGKHVYTHQNPTRLHIDRYEALETRIAVFDTSAGLDATPVQTWPAPRQVTILRPGSDGTLYLGGQDIYAMDPTTGEVRVVLASLSSDDPRYGQRDVLTIWPIGGVNNEMIRMYSAPRFTDDTQNMETAEFVWGYERVDLETGEAESRDYGPLEVVLFSGMSRPGNSNEFFAVLTQLKKFDVTTQKEIASVDLDHSYYCINFSTDGSEVYLAGTFNDIAIYDADTLTKLGNIQLEGGDMSLANTEVFAKVL